MISHGKRITDAEVASGEAKGLSDSVRKISLSEQEINALTA